VILTHEAHLPHQHEILVAAAFTVGLSVYAHGLSAQPLTDRYVRWYRGHRAAAHPEMESRPAASHRSRGAILYPITRLG
jgi:NhaP-type Na+/H+ or K+/H+ antiporter